MFLRSDNKVENDNDYESIPMQETDVQARALEGLDNMPIADAARLAVKLVGPRVYKLTGIEGDKLIIYLTGCSGSGKPEQFNVARLMEKMASRSKETRPTMIIIAGDMIYPQPPKSPVDAKFNSNIYDVYHNRCFTTLPTVPIYGDLGNHELLYFKTAKNLIGNNHIDHAASLKSAETVAAATFVPDGIRFHKVSEVAKFFMQDEIDVRNCPLGIINPYYYYAVQAGDIHITFANSNTLPRGFLNYTKLKNSPYKYNTYDPEVTGQIPWLKKTYEDFIQMFHVHVMHNPRKPVGKRASKPDTDRFLEPHDQTDLNAIFNSNTKYYHDFINLVLQRLGIKSKLHVNAHEHLLGYVNTLPLPLDTAINSENENSFDPEIRQVGSGGGGGDLEHGEVLNSDDVAALMSKNGFWEISIDLKNPKDVQLTLYTIDHGLDLDDEIEPDHILKFNLTSKQPQRNKSADNRVEVLREIFLQACKEFFAQWPFINSKNKSDNFFNSMHRTITGYVADAKSYWTGKYKPNDIDCVHDLIAYVNQPEAPNLEMLVLYYNKIYDKLENKNVFETILKKVLQKFAETEKDFDPVLYMTLLELSDLAVSSPNRLQK